MPRKIVQKRSNLAHNGRNRETTIDAAQVRDRKQMVAYHQARERDFKNANDAMEVRLLALFKQAEAAGQLTDDEPPDVSELIAKARANRR